MDYDQIFDMQNETMNQSDYIYHVTPTEIALDCIKFVICFIGTTIDILIIYIIIRYKNMKKPVNIYIMNWLICNALFILTDPAEYQLYSIMKGFGISWDVICVMFTSLLIIRTLNVLFMLLLTLYWFFDKTKVLLFERYSYGVVAAVWIFGLFDFIFTAIPCLLDDFYNAFGEIFLSFIIVVFTICLLVIHCKRRCANPFASTSSLPIALLTSYAICWVAMIATTFLYHVLDREVYRVVSYLCQLLAYLYPTLMFYLFYKMDEKFAACVRVLFKSNRSEDIDVCFDEIEEENGHES